MFRFRRSEVRPTVPQVMLVYMVSGFALASWGSQLPQFQHVADLSGEQIGWVVAALAAGTLVALLFAGRAVAWLGPRVAVCGGAALCVVALVGVPFHPAAGVLAAAAVALGVGNAVYDVAMNVQGSALGRRRGDTLLMPTLHGAWSIGALLGALGGAVAAHSGLRLSTHLMLVALVIALGAGLGSWSFDRADDSEAPVAGGAGGFTSVWVDRRTVSLGLLALGAAFAEGSANDWLTLALVDGRPGYGWSHQAAATGLALFVVGMIVGRFGSRFLPARWPPDRLLLAGGLLVVLGTALILTGGLALADVNAPAAAGAAVIGLLAWGLGASLGVPLAMDAAALPRSRRAGVEFAAPEHSAAERVSVVSTIGYAAFLAGPPLLGWLAEAHGFLWTLVAAPVVMAAAYGLAAVCHPLGVAMRAGVVGHGGDAGERSPVLTDRRS